MSRYPEHRFSVEHVGPIKHGQGGKAAQTRFRAVCTCGYATKWRKYSGALHEDQWSHLRLAREAGERVDSGVLAPQIMPERILYHRAGSAAKAKAILTDGFQRTSGDQYGIGLWTCTDENMWKGGPVQFKLRVTYWTAADYLEVPEAARAWNGNPQDVDAIYESKGIDVVRTNELNFLIRKSPTIEIIGYRMLEPEEGPWRPYDERDPVSKEAALTEIRTWWP